MRRFFTSCIVILAGCGMVGVMLASAATPVPTRLLPRTKVLRLYRGKLRWVYAPLTTPLHGGPDAAKGLSSSSARRVYVVPHPKTVPVVDRSWDHIRGDLNAHVSLVAYMAADDAQSRLLYPMLQDLLSEYPDALNIVYRQFPQAPQKESRPAALALECTDELGDNETFWQFADKLYGKTPRWDYTAMAKEIGLDGDKFLTCAMMEHRSAHLRQDIENAKSAGITGTPISFVIDAITGSQQELDGVPSMTDFRKAIDAVKGNKP